MKWMPGAVLGSAVLATAIACVGGGGAWSIAALVPLAATAAGCLVLGLEGGKERQGLRHALVKVEELSRSDAAKNLALEHAIQRANSRVSKEDLDAAVEKATREEDARQRKEFARHHCLVATLATPVTVDDDSVTALLHVRNMAPYPVMISEIAGTATIRVEGEQPWQVALAYVSGPVPIAGFDVRLPLVVLQGRVSAGARAAIRRRGRNFVEVTVSAWGKQRPEGASADSHVSFLNDGAPAALQAGTAPCPECRLRSVSSKEHALVATAQVRAQDHAAEEEVEQVEVGAKTQSEIEKRRKA